MDLDQEILSALRRAGDDAVSGADLAQRLGVTRAAVWARIEELRRLGYEITARPHQGYKLVAAPDLLHADDLLSRLGHTTRVIGRDIRVFNETTSTNDVVDKLARDGVKEGVVVFAESQTKGRGRLGRRWISPARKGLWFSVLLRPPLRPSAATQLTVMAATALCRAIQSQTNLRPEIKWPNDILIHGRKVAGVLTELTAEIDHIKYAILGVGVDVNVTEFPAALAGLATSLRLETGQPIDRAQFAVALLRALDADYDQVCRGDFGTLADEWERQCTTLGQRVRIVMGPRQIEGRAEALDANGALLVRTEHGHLESLTGGDLTLEK